MAKAQLHGKAPSEEKKNLAGKTQRPLEQGLQAETPSLQNAVNTLHRSTHSGIHLLQRTIGNRAVQSLVERKQHGTDGSTVIQRHVGAMAEQLGSFASVLLSGVAEDVGRGYGGVLAAQTQFQAYQQVASSHNAPLPTGDESGSNSFPESADEGEEIVM